MFRKLFRFFRPTPPPLAYTEAARRAGIEKILAIVRAPLPTERELKRVEIIVLNYKTPEVEVECAKRIIENTTWPYKLVMYDNRPGVKNFSKIWNQLVRESTCDYVIIMDSDVFVPASPDASRGGPCWLTRMMRTFAEHDDCFVVVPRVTNTSCDEQRATQAEDKPAEPIKEIFAAMLALYKKDVFEKVGWFDEDFLFFGQDSEFAARLAAHGFPAYLQHNVLVNHVGHYSTKKAAKTNDIPFDSTLEREFAGRLLEEKIRDYAKKEK